MLILPIKKKWFDMIVSGEKKEEYREIKPYYDSRFNRYLPKEIEQGEYEVQETIVKALENSIPKEVIEKEIEELKDMKIDGEVFITSVNFAIKILQGILEGK